MNDIFLPPKGFFKFEGKFMRENIFISYIKSSIEELGRVTWPTKNQAVRLTIIVFIFCLLFALFLGALDLGFSTLYKYILNLI